MLKRGLIGQSVAKAFWAVLLGMICAVFAWVLKITAEGSERYLFRTIQDASVWLLLITPLGAFLPIYFLAKKVFKSPLNGIREILTLLREPAMELKPVKAIIHFITGTFTIVFGGSTGIEVPTVISSSAIGSWIGGQERFDANFRRNLIIAGAGAGIAGLFGSPFAGIFFVLEVLMVTISWELIVLSVLASFAAFAIRYSIDHENLFHPVLDGWKIQAIPFYLLFSLPAAFLSVALTKSVIHTKAFLTRRFSPIGKIWMGGIILGAMLLMASPLYGEGYSFIDRLMSSDIPATSYGIQGIFLLITLLLLKPLATSVTLASGGDGGIFAPSLFLGAVAGYLFSQSVNYLGGSVIEVNFIIAGMAAILSASLHAPLTAAALTMSITGSYELLIPITLTSFLSSYLAKRIFPFTVYSYG